MGKVKNDVEFSQEAQKEFKGIEKGLGKGSQKIIAEEKARDGYLVISDKKGDVIKVPAKDL
jgi:hypothetical protein